MRRIHRSILSILAIAVFAAAFLPGRAQAGNVGGVTSTTGAVVVHGNAHRAVLGSTHHRTGRTLVATTPFGIGRAVTVTDFTVPASTVTSFTVAGGSRVALTGFNGFTSRGHGHHTDRFVVATTPFGVGRAVTVTAFTVPASTVTSFTVPAGTLVTGTGFVVVNGGFALTGINGFTTGSIGPFTTFSNSFGTVPVIVTGVGHFRGAHVGVGRGVSMTGRR